jgi:hypothetical protein
MTTNALIDELLTNYKMETDIGVLPKIFFDYGLKDYFTKACEYFNIFTFYGSFEAFSAIKRENITRVKDLEFYKICKYVALVYEGCSFNRLSYKEVQVGLIYSLFKTLGFKTFQEEINCCIKETKKLSPQQYNELQWIFPKEKFKQSCDLYNVFTDANQMYVYWCTALDSEVASKINNHFKKMRDISSELCIEYIFTEIKKTSWKTRWGKMKAFHRNFYSTVETLRKQTIKELSIS